MAVNKELAPEEKGEIKKENKLTLYCPDLEDYPYTTKTYYY